MDPRAPVAVPSSDRFPRPRGDGPTRSAGRCGSGRVSPPTRGWTRRRVRRVHGAVGFPAHAGMDLCRHNGRSLRRRFPRPRGDGPSQLGRPAAHRQVSPPTRGWTSSTPSRRVSESGFPAHAGMDLIWVKNRPVMVRFPRPRGDGPLEPQSDRDRAVVSPPTRGWTSAVVFLQLGAAGFPAHAGMDPRIRLYGAFLQGFPRPRGDGPSVSGPYQASSMVSPPTRGWTLGRTRLLSHHEGFPAHAGMDPSRKPISWRR